METGATGVYRERAERRRRVRGTGEARGDGWQHSEADDRLLQRPPGTGRCTRRPLRSLRVRA
ncbi:hypothetical protein [Streptomyces sp. Ac-502]|uniref:hypothetical protein n=1 Tax=Streptomyces sp. Ac-502 TaxID=3342801 RepID=UPI0038629291